MKQSEKGFVVIAGLTLSRMNNLLLKASIAVLLITLLALSALVFIISFIARHLSKPLLRLSTEANDIAADIKHGSRLTYADRPDEVGVLARNFNHLLETIEAHREELAEQKAEAKLGKVAAQVAHDIRSPLSALESMISLLGKLPEEPRVIIRSAISRIRDIANNLVHRNRNSKQHDQSDVNNPELSQTRSIELLSSIIDPLITEKRMQYKNREHIIIESDLGKESYGLFAEISVVEFKRLISNLINNAVEAMSDKGNVTVSLELRNNEIAVIIQDTGKGIPKDILPKLTKLGETHGKVGGSGLGLYHAKQSVESWGGKLFIESTLGKGTRVILMLARAQTPSWFLPELKVTTDSTVVIIDDDTSIHHVWDARLRQLDLENNGISIKHCSTSIELIEWHRSFASKKKVLYLFDYELIGESQSGLDLIEELKLKADSILITSRYEEPPVRATCAQLGIPLIPKPLAGFVPIVLVPHIHQSKYDAVLIDDDPLIHALWNMTAKEKKKKLRTYTSPQEFMMEYERIDKAIPLYIDSHLSDTMKGEVIAKDLYETGFKEIYLCTGYRKDDFPEMPWIKDILSKDPPF